MGTRTAVTKRLPSDVIAKLRRELEQLSKSESAPVVRFVRAAICELSE